MIEIHFCIKNKLFFLLDNMRRRIDVSAVLITTLCLLLISLTQSNYLLWNVWIENNRARPDTYIWIVALILSALCFKIACDKPAVASGMALGVHGLISSLGDLAKVNLSAIIIFSIVAGQTLSLIVRCHNVPRPNFHKNKNVTIFLFLLLVVFFTGMIGEYAARNVLNRTAWTWGDVPKIISDRENPITTIIILVHWLPYLLIIYLGAFIQGLNNVLKAYSIAVLAQFIFIPLDHYAEYFSWIYKNKTLEGFEWVAINRAYLGYEAAIASLWFMTWGQAIKKRSLRYVLFLLMALSCLIVIMAWSKGPILALTLVLVASSLRYSPHIYQKKTLGKRLLLTLLLCVTSFFVLTTALVINKGMFSKKIIDSLRIEQSIKIRAELLSKAAFPGELDVTGWLLGRGFGWSRWQMSNQGAEFIGSGTHIFWLDLLLDVGLFGLFCFIFALVLLWQSTLHKDCQNDRLAEPTYWFFAMFSVVLLFKLAVASDTYSEPIMAMFLALLLARASLSVRRS